MTTGRTPLDVPTQHDVDELAGWLAILTAAAGVGYAIAFVVLKSSLASAILLLAGAVASVPVLVTVYRRLRSVEADIALWAFVFAIVGAAGAAIHGGYDLANELHPDQALSGFPNAVDPRGLLTFGSTGIALLIGGYLVARMPGLPRWGSWLTLAAGVAMIATWLGRLVVTDGSSPYVLGPALVAGVLSPLVYVAVGLWLTRSAGGAAAMPASPAEGPVARR